MTEKTVATTGVVRILGALLFTVSVIEHAKHGKREFRVSAENLKTGEVFNSPRDNTKILEIMPLEFWPAFVRQSLLVGPSDEQSVLF